MHIPHSFATIVFGVSLAGAVTGAVQTQRVSAEQQVLATDDERNEALRRGDPAPLERMVLSRQKNSVDSARWKIPNLSLQARDCQRKTA